MGLPVQTGGQTAPRVRNLVLKQVKLFLFHCRSELVDFNFVGVLLVVEVDGVAVVGGVDLWEDLLQVLLEEGCRFCWAGHHDFLFLLRCWKTEVLVVVQCAHCFLV